MLWLGIKRKARDQDVRCVQLGGDQDRAPRRHELARIFHALHEDFLRGGKQAGWGPFQKRAAPYRKVPLREQLESLYRKAGSLFPAQIKAMKGLRESWSFRNRKVLHEGNVLTVWVLTEKHDEAAQTGGFFVTFWALHGEGRRRG